MSSRFAALASAGLALVVLLTGCSKSTPNSAPPSSSGASASSSASTPSSSAPPTATAAPTLGGECADLVPLDTVEEALGRPVIGRTQFVRGIAEPDIGRLTYLNCRYGLATPVRGKPAPEPQLEIGISLYDSADQAATRVRGTVADYRSHGAKQQDAAVGGDPATILVGYGNPTLVVAEGPRTVAVTVDPKLVAAAPTAGLVALAQAALVATAGFDGVPGVTATPSPSDTSGSDTGMPSGSASASPSGS
ncbi:MAG TPA: hypothetical protein VFU36_09340 [Jatrophihabitans sp.]|nr:hypothetical protein [Jatrophihabitans sp.]